MTLVNHDTGEIVEPLTRADAERLTTRIRLRLDTIADNYVAVMPLIREAIERRAFAALGYTGVSQYVAECFGDALSHLGVEVRREVVRELTAAGMSTRAIAPVVGVSNYTVHADQAAVRDLTPQAPESAATPDSESTAPAEGPREGVVDTPPTPVSVTGLDGKTYSRPTPIDHEARARAAVAEFGDLAYFYDLEDYEHCWRLADTLRSFSATERVVRLATLRRSIEVDRAKRAGTYSSPAPTVHTCPTCGQTVKD